MIESAHPIRDCREGTPTRALVSRRGLALIPALVVAVLAHSAWGGESDLWRSYEQRDFFSLRDHLPPASAKDSNRIRFVRAATQGAFGDHTAAVQSLNQLLASSPDQAMEERARRLLMREERAAYHYRAALAAIAPLLPKDPTQDGPQKTDLRNVALMLGTLADVRPQRIDRPDRPSVIRPDAAGRYPMTINGDQLQLGFDSGAEFSLLAASTAKKAGLKIRHARIALASSTGVDAGVELAVGDVVIGSSRIRNVVFLVVPDAGLTMPDGFFMPGLIGSPVMSALGPMRYSPDGSLHLGAASSPQRPNMALDSNRILLPIRFEGEDLVCRLDTGADNTVFYEPFYKRFPDLFTDASHRHELKLGGVSGAHEIPAYKLASIDFVLAGRPVHLTGPDVMQRSIVPSAEDDYMICNIGMDALKPSGSYTIDLKALRLDLQDGGS